MLREIPCENVDCAVNVGVDYSTASVAYIEAAMNTVSLMLLCANAACLARIVLWRLDNADADHSGLVRKHLDDSLVRPFMEMLITAVSPVFTVSDVLKVPHDDRGDTASVCIADKRFGETVEQVGALAGTLLIKGTSFSGKAFRRF